MSFFHRALCTSIASGAVAAATVAVPAMAQERLYQFSIPAQDMPTSLRAFARTAGQQVTFDRRELQGKRAPALKGHYSAREGMSRLLAGSGLDANWGRSGVIVVRPLASRPVAASNFAEPVLSTSGASGDAPRDDIVVTGSRIARNVVTDSPVPVVAIGEDDLQASGATELSEVLTDYPAVTPTLNLANSTNQINASGISSVNLRSLGSNRTLTLIDGRRTVSNVLTSNSVSLSSIPQLFVSRVEIITGGASAVYGADAVAGVVNIITRDGYSGVRVGGRVGLSSQGDSFRGNLDFLAGERFLDDRLSVMIGASYEKEAGVMARQRKRSLESISYSLAADADPLNQGDLGIDRPALSSNVPGGRFHSSSTPGGGYFYYDANGNLAQSNDLAVYGWEFRPDLQFSTPRTSYIAAGKIGYDLGGGVEFFGHVQYSKIDTETERGGGETASNSSSYGLQDEFELGRISRNNPFVPAAIRAVTGSSGIPWRRRFVEMGTYTIANDRQTWRGWTGLKGEAGNWNWEISYGYGRFHQDQIRTNLLNYDKLKKALNAEFDPAAPGDLSRVRCVDAAARADGCVPINLFGPGSITPAAADYVRTGMELDALVTQNVLQAYASGDLFELPAGPVAVAFGGEYRRDWQRSITDEVTRQGFGSASFIAEYEGNIKAKEVFAEASIPILADQPFFHRLTLDLAARYGSYNIRNVGRMFSYRAGGEWAPVEDLRFRGQYARAQRAPTVTNLYSPQRDDADRVVDVCDGVTAATTGTIAVNCRSVSGIAAAIAADGVFRQISTSIEGPSAGNPDLKEETADTLTLGVVATPTFLPGLSMTFDYFKIKIRDAIGSLDGDELLRECYGNPEGITDNFFCNEITRDPDGQLRRVVNRDLNLNKIVRSGFDVGVDYRFDAPEWLAGDGRFDLRLLYSRLLDFKTIFDGVNGVSVSDEKGQIGAWRNQGQVQLGYREGGLRLRWKARYTGKAVDSNERLAIAREAGSNPPFLHVGDRWRHDFYASMEVPAGDRELRLYAGVNNAFNSTSPFLPSGTVSGSSQNIAGEYDVIGRYFYTGFEAKF
ncbi:TonB-dependent receptor [Sphingopyxis sp. MWB1]|uniref:TonB-dependent receptor n=1 Tax=Sphingopyxis sp. MWB1 TaxID=1537715 RepID=UPI00051A6D25|nr:TonB-dependent receptor [Sphingopyxis sp. MWB1]